MGTGRVHVVRIFLADAFATPRSVDLPDGCPVVLSSLHFTEDDGIVVFMGLTHLRVKVGNPANGRKAESVRCLVDSGAVYSLVPGAVLRRLGIKPHSAREFVLANGDVITRKLATATFEYQGQRGDSMVIVGEPGDEALLGATTLEGFGLVLDPFRRELRPLQLTLKDVGGVTPRD